MQYNIEHPVAYGVVDHEISYIPKTSTPYNIVTYAYIIISHIQVFVHMLHTPVTYVRAVASPWRSVFSWTTLDSICSGRQVAVLLPSAGAATKLYL